MSVCDTVLNLYITTGHEFIAVIKKKCPNDPIKFCVFNKKQIFRTILMFNDVDLQSSGVSPKMSVECV